MQAAVALIGGGEVACAVVSVAVCEIIDLACARGRHVDAVEGGTGYVYHIFTCTRTCTRM